MSITVERPRTVADARRLVRTRSRDIERLEAVLAMPLPAQDRKHLTLRLKGLKNNRQSWIDWIEKKGSK